MLKSIKRAVTLILMSLLLVTSISAQEAKRPNVLFIFADDLTVDAVHALGNPIIRTPNIDKFTEEGVTFTNTFNMGAWNGAICAASRMMMNSGLSVWRAEKALKGMQEVENQNKMWSKMMSRAGYDTYMTGKWHVQAPAGAVFDTAIDIRPGMPNQTDERYNRVFEPGNEDWTPWDKKFNGYWKGGKHWSEIVGDNAIEFLSTSEKSEDPFFMYIAFNAPHDPRQSPKKYVDMYPLETIPVPENFVAAPEHFEAMGLGTSPKLLRDERLAPYPRTEYSVKVNIQEYYAITTHMDDQIGRIMAKLEAIGELDNTYIFFSADHGLSVGHHGLIGKQSLYEHSIRPPMMVVGPGVPKDKKIDAMVYLQDIMASAIDIADVDKPDYVEFNSLMPLIRGDVKRQYDNIYLGYTTKQRGIRDDRYKLILYPEDKTVMLFDLKKDPLEMNNLATVKKHKGRVKDMFKKLLAEQKRLEDVKADLVAAYPELM